MGQVCNCHLRTLQLAGYKPAPRSFQKEIQMTAFQIHDTAELISPSLVVFHERLVANLEEMIRIAGGPENLCPHCKTHKTREIVEMQVRLGINYHKCATIAEAEMLAEVGVQEVLIAYQMVGPNVKRFRQLVDKFPATRFACLVDNPMSATALEEAITGADRCVGVLIDLDSGMNRTGIELGPQAIELCEMLLSMDKIEVDGLHWYDGHNRQVDEHERAVAVNTGWNQFIKFRDQLLMSGLPVNRIVAAGSGSFPILAEKSEPNLILSPGTTTYWDADLHERFPEMNFKPALGILTRVISCNRHGHLTLDVGHKSCAADQPAGKRLHFPTIPDAKELLQSEEHLVIETKAKLKLGDSVVAIPRHACPASAVHKFAYVVKDGQVSETWNIAARDRVLSI